MQLLFTNIPFQPQTYSLKNNMNSIKYEKCRLHPAEYLQIVCLDCTSECLACPLCIDAHHLNHSMISLKKFITHQIPQLYHEPLNTQLIQQKLNSLHESFRHDLQRMRKTVGTAINELEVVYNRQMERLIKQLMVIAGEGSNIYTAQNIVAVKKKIHSKLKIDSTQILTEKLQAITKKMSYQILQATNEISKVINNLQGVWKATETLLLNSRSIQKFSFSENNKHQSIAIYHNSTNAINNIYDNSYHMVLVDPPLTPFENKITFRIQNSHHKCVWLGVCHLERVRELNFTNCFKVGDGAYWIWQAGCEEGAQYFSHIPAETPSLQWNFDTEDEIQIAIEFGETNTITFKKKELVFCASLKMEGYYYACVGLGDEKEAVSIINK